MINLADLNKNQLDVAGGKGANLGELNRIAGLMVPSGFCITTRAYRDFVSASSEFDKLLNALEITSPDSLERLTNLAGQIRSQLDQLPMPETIRDDILDAWQAGGSQFAYAVRSSATAEDLPGASFAGQQETFLNIRGAEQLLEAVRNCWSSLFTERAVVYRSQNHFGHRRVQLAVIVQQMVFSEISGIMFTADPVSGNRRVTSIDSSFGLGEALVSGLVSADLYQVKDEQIIRKQVSKKNLLVKALPEGGTERAAVIEQNALASSLSDQQVLQLAGLGRRIEAHFGNPQDIEWAIAGGQIFILQSRPITTLYPQPHIEDSQLHLLVSFGHVQMMTEAMKPLGISVIRSLLPFGKTTPNGETRYALEAGNRLYADITPLLRYPQICQRIPNILMAIDESAGRSLAAFLEKDEFREALLPEQKISWPVLRVILPYVFRVASRIICRNNSHTIEKMNSLIEDTVQEYRVQLASATGAARITLIQELLSNAIRGFVPWLVTSLPPAIGTYFLIGDLSQKWLGDQYQLGSISKSPTGNVTTEMGLQIGDLADSIRDYPQVIAYLKTARDEDFFTGLEQVGGGKDVLPAFREFFARYGMRGTGEIDITRLRWNETPTQMIPILMMNVEQNHPGQARREFEKGQAEAEAAASLLVERLRHKPWGFFKAMIMRRLIKVHRSLIGVREHPKYFMVQSFWLIKQAILEEADQLVKNGVLGNKEDLYWFSLPEVKDIVARQQVDPGLIAERREAYQLNQQLSPPRMMTSEGEIIREIAAKDLPPGALAGSPVSAGVVQGRARIILHLEEAEMERGDILVAPYTDPSWTPLFTLAAGVVTEVGGLMTHGAVVAREYGIPAVVGVNDATRLIKDGQTILIDGSQGFVKLLPEK